MLGQVPTNKSKDLLGRFQYQSWYVKLWRLRYMVVVPFLALYYWYRSYKPLNYYFQLEVSIALVKMNWVYNMNEVLERFNNKTR